MNNRLVIQFGPKGQPASLLYSALEQSILIEEIVQGEIKAGDIVIKDQPEPKRTGRQVELDFMDSETAFHFLEHVAAVAIRLKVKEDKLVFSDDARVKVLVSVIN